MNKLLKCALVAACLLSTARFCLAQGETSSVKFFKNYASDKQSIFSALKSFQASGTIEITLPDEDYKAVGGDKVSHFRFKILASGDQLKETVQTLTPTGGVSRTETYYLDSKRITNVDDLGGRLIAKMFTLGKEVNDGLFNFCPSFFEYAFLNGSIQYPGIPALLISDLSSKQKWDTSLKLIKDVSNAEVKGNKLSIKDRVGSVVLGFATPTAGQSAQVSSIEFFDDKDVLLRKIELLSSISDQTFGTVGVGYKVSIYNVTSDNTPVTWVYKIDDIKFNVPIDNDSLEFDPASVDTIFEGDNKQYITVPR